MSIFDRQTTLGVIVSSRAFFNAGYAPAARDNIVRQIEALGAKVCIPPTAETPNGAVETRADAQKYARFFDTHRHEIDGFVVVLPNFGDEIAVIETIVGSGLKLPILVQACNDAIDKVDVKSRRDAFCGKISVCNNLYQYGIPWTDTTSHTCDIESAEFAGDLDRFVRVCRTVRGLKSARIGSIGARTQAFQTVRHSEKLLQQSGITVTTVDMSEIIAAAKNIGEADAAVAAKLAEISAYGRIPAEIAREKVAKQARLSVAIDRWMECNECDACAIQCWTSIQDNYGCATCLTMSMLSQRLIPSACEVDVTGAVSMYALALASGRPPALLDWNNNYGSDAEKCVCTHCGNYPKDFIGATPEISNLDVLATTIGADKCFGAVKGKVKAGDMTYFRLTTDDAAGCIRAYVGDGRLTDDPFAMDGGIAVTEVPDLRNLLRHITRNGFEHHVAMVRGSYADAVEEAAARYLGWSVYRHAPQSYGTK
jgi:L-fucose isomerase-like protein